MAHVIMGLSANCSPSMEYTVTLQWLFGHDHGLTKWPISFLSLDSVDVNHATEKLAMSRA